MLNPLNNQLRRHNLSDENILKFVNKKYNFKFKCQINIKY